MSTEPEKPQAGPELADVARYAAARGKRNRRLRRRMKQLWGRLWCTKEDRVINAVCRRLERDLRQPHNAPESSRTEPKIP